MHEHQLLAGCASTMIAESTSVGNAHTHDPDQSASCPGRMAHVIAKITPAVPFCGVGAGLHKGLQLKAC